MKPSILSGSAVQHELSQAILIYRRPHYGDDSSYAVTVHDVALHDGVPMICPGLAATSAQIADFARKLSGSVGDRSIFSERVLYTDPGMLLWWVPAHERAMFFGGDSRLGDSKLKAHSPLIVHHPPLVFRATEDRLDVFALKENQRPEPDTALCRAPYLNIYDAGNMCRGDVRYPEQVDPTESGLQAWETAFFQSRFTHSNYRDKMLADGKHDVVWRYLARYHKPFPVELLLELPVTVSSLLNGGVK